MYHRTAPERLFPPVVSTGPQIHPTSIIESGATLGRDVRVGPFAVIHDNVSVGDGTFVDSHTVLGAPTGDYYADAASYEPAPCAIGRGSLIRSHCVVYAGVSIGGDFQCGHHVTIREGAQVGEGVRIGTLCDLQPDVSIGDYARLH